MWHKLPLPLGLLDLIGLRVRLRTKNLYDTYNGPKDRPVVGEEKPRYLTARTADGTYNDLTDPHNGQRQYTLWAQHTPKCCQPT